MDIRLKFRESVRWYVIPELDDGKADEQSEWLLRHLTEGSTSFSENQLSIVSTLAKGHGWNIKVVQIQRRDGTITKI